MNEVHFLNLEYILTAIFNFLHAFDPVAIINWLLWFIALLRPFAFTLTLILIAICIYSYIRIRQIDAAEEAKHEASIEVPSPEKELNEKWKRVEEHASSSNPNDWRMAILEADIMLGDVLDKAGFSGDTIGDQLKSVGKGDMLTLDQAWEAHRARNQIAHDGSDFELNEREARRIIELYKRVFEEFYYI